MYEVLGSNLGLAILTELPVFRIPQLLSMFRHSILITNKETTPFDAVSLSKIRNNFNQP
jgi:hypothetical protein